MTTPPTRPDTLPAFATSGNYSDPGRIWDGQPRLDDAAMAAFAADGLEPRMRTPAPAFNAWLARARAWIALADSDDLGIAADTFGGAYSGNVTISSDTDLTADLHADVLTVDATFTLNPNGFRIFARSIVNNGSILETGADGAPGSGGGGGAGGAARAQGTLSATGAGGQGGGATVDPGDPGVNLSCALGGAGGAGGDANAVAGGAAGTLTRPTAAMGAAGSGAVEGYMGHINQVLSGRALDGTLFRGGTGGGGGGGDGDEGGGGGAGGPVVLIVAREIENNGVIGARGGDGGAGFQVEGGGGGGGGGGALVIVSRTPITGSGSTSVAGGAGGAGGSGGSVDDGAAGSAGIVYQFTA
jgi:hypothetical protein